MRVYKHLASANVTFYETRSNNAVIEKGILEFQEYLLLRNLLRRGSGGRIRTHVLSESESDALPLGDTRMFHSHDIYYQNYCIFFNPYSKIL